jgi:exoribonuclease R
MRYYFTIDPKDAKDFDDASFKKIRKWKLRNRNSYC